jgi:hypothetical protein
MYEEKRLRLYYAEIRVKYCVNYNLNFCEGLAIAYARILKNQGEKIFLYGNSFLAKIAKAVFEQNGDFFAETCERYKDITYFRKCAEYLEGHGFIFEEGNECNRESWLSLYKIILLLTKEYLATEEYLTTEYDLPRPEVFEYKEYNENIRNLKIIITPQNTSVEDIKEAYLLPLDRLADSSDSIAIDESSFYDFLKEKFPFRNNKEKLVKFMERIYDEEYSEALAWLYKEIIDNSMLSSELRPAIVIGVMRAGILSAYKDNVIYISQRLVLDSLRSQEGKYILLLTLLHEYGYFLDDILHKKSKNKNSYSGYENGKILAYRLMEYSLENSYSQNFNFAGLSFLSYTGKNQKIPLRISNLSPEHRKGILVFFEFGRKVKNLRNKNLKLLNGNKIKKVFFYKVTPRPKDFFFIKTHQKLTESAWRHKYTNGLKRGSVWPDFPSEAKLKTNTLCFISALAKLDLGLLYSSHFGVRQHWHSMDSHVDWVEAWKLARSIELIVKEGEEEIFLIGEIRKDLLRCFTKPKENKLTNGMIRTIILKQCEKWYSKAIECKNQGNKEESHFFIGKLCHTVQDSFVLAHCWRRYYGDEEFVDLPEITAKDAGKIWAFQDYKVQDHRLHKFADSPKQEDITTKGILIKSIPTIGYKSAKKATKEIMQRYEKNFEWEQDDPESSSPKEYLESIYEICPGREDEPSGGSHPWFLKENELSREKIRKNLYKFSSKFKGK